MKYGARKFNQKSYDDNDKLAKEKFISYLKNVRGHNILLDIETYDHDIITEKDGIEYYFEVEIKHGYPFTNRKSFKFPTVSFLGRKERLHDKKEFHYVILSYETGWALSCVSSQIFKKEYINELEISTKEREGLDCFYRIPKEKCLFFNLNTKKTY
jgi:hypothetical protein